MGYNMCYNNGSFELQNMSSSGIDRHNNLNKLNTDIAYYYYYYFLVQKMAPIDRKDYS